MAAERKLPSIRASERAGCVSLLTPASTLIASPPAAKITIEALSREARIAVPFAGSCSLTFLAGMKLDFEHPSSQTDTRWENLGARILISNYFPAASQIKKSDAMKAVFDKAREYVSTKRQSVGNRFTGK